MNNLAQKSIELEIEDLREDLEDIFLSAERQIRDAYAPVLWMPGVERTRQENERRARVIELAMSLFDGLSIEQDYLIRRLLEAAWFHYIPTEWYDRNPDGWDGLESSESKMIFAVKALIRTKPSTLDLIKFALEVECERCL